MLWPARGRRVASGLLSTELGREMLDWAIERGQQRGCQVEQFTTEKQHEDARRFYEKLGFVATQVGMKLKLIPSVHSGATAQENGKIRP